MASARRRNCDHEDGGCCTLTLSLCGMGYSNSLDLGFLYICLLLSVVTNALFLLLVI